MNSPLFDIEPLLPALSRGETVITATDRLARHARFAFACAQRRNGKQTGAQPPIYALNHWLEQRWQRLLDTGHSAGQSAVASLSQCLQLWNRVIDQSNSQILLPVHTLASTADSARQILELWEQSARQLAANGEFPQWLDTFYQTLTACGLITAEQAALALANAQEQGLLDKTAGIHLVGFEQLAPLHRRLLEATAEQLHWLTPKDHPEARAVRVELPDAAAEWRAAAHWSRQILERQPQARIGIIVPDLGHCRGPLERVFAEVFEPDWSLPDTERYTPPFNFSAGTPLGGTPLVYDTLQLLSLLEDSLSLEALCGLLQSPFFGDAEAEWPLRAALTRQLRRRRLDQPRGADWRYHCQQLDDPGGPDSLSQRLEQLGNLARSQSRPRLPGDWMEVFLEALNHLGWPGSRRPDSQEFQQLGQFYRLLEAFAALDGVSRPLRLPEALGQLRQLASRTPFQAQTPDSPIQILGTLEAAGLRFSHCWVLGLHNRQWPPQANPNPLLLLDLQRRLQMPRASVERELQFAEDLTRQYRQCADQVVFSSPAGQGDEQLRPSALIDDLPPTPWPELINGQFNDLASYRQELQRQGNLQLVDCQHGPPLEDNRAQGGSGLFKEQASCPFNAFARYRLDARQEEAPAPGLSAAERGRLLHDALEIIWRQLRDSQQLLALTPGAEAALIHKALEQALEYPRRQRPKELGNRYCQLELERSSHFLRRWLALEKTRPPFEVVAVEEKHTAVLAGLTLHLRIDRIDRLAGGELLLIDYKTGQPKVSQWLGERPEEPQLPLYTLIHKEAVSGLAFAQLHPKAIQWLGLGELSEPFAGIQSPEDIRNAPADNWTDLRQHWQKVLQQLAEEFRRGEARVEFSHSAAEKYSADLTPLNRAPERDNLYAYARARRLLP